MSYEIYNINLIDIYMVKKLLPEIPDSVDDDLVNSTIIECQEAYILTILGDDFYEQILQQHSGNTLSTANTYIYNRFIVKILSKRIAIRLIYSSTYQFENQGIRIKVSEQSIAADRTEMTELKHIYESDSDRISKAMICYINENIGSYPLFRNSPFCTVNDRTLYSRQSFGGF